MFHFKLLRELFSFSIFPRKSNVMFSFLFRFVAKVKKHRKYNFCYLDETFCFVDEKVIEANKINLLVNALI